MEQVTKSGGGQVKGESSAPAAAGPGPAHAPSTATVLIPCHNAAPFIRQAIESCLGQTRPPEQIVVVDDGSTDGSSAILDEFARSGAILLVRNQTCEGKCESLNRLFDSVITKYVLLLDADDMALPHRCERQIAFMEAHPRVGCSSSFVYYINREGRRLAKGVLDLLQEKDLKRYLGSLEPFGLFGPAVVIRTEVFQNPMLRFRKEHWLGEDLDLWNRIAEAGWEVLAQPEYLTLYRVHSASVVTSKARETRLQFEWMRACLRARRQGRPEPTRQEFDLQMAQRPWYAKLNHFRKVEAKVACRAAGFAFAERRFFRAAIVLTKAFCLQPLYVIRRLFHQICGL